MYQPCCIYIKGILTEARKIKSLDIMALIMEQIQNILQLTFKTWGNKDHSNDFIYKLGNRSEHSVTSQVMITTLIHMFTIVKDLYILLPMIFRNVRGHKLWNSVNVFRLQG